VCRDQARRDRYVRRSVDRDRSMLRDDAIR
jgi:hypothetical protein